MTGTPSNLRIRAANEADAPRLEAIRHAAFAPVFESFRALLGDETYRLSDAPRDGEQSEYLASLLAPGSEWEVHVAESDGLVLGFVSIQCRPATGVGEIGLNAVHPDYANAGVGTAMYEFALDRMRERGMRVAAVGTGADASHAPARRAYEKAGFSVGIPSIWLYRQL